MATSASDAATEKRGEEDSGLDTLRTAVVGAVAGLLLAITLQAVVVGLLAPSVGVLVVSAFGFVPLLSPIGGGIVAGYLQGGTRWNGTKAGVLSCVLLLVVVTVGAVAFGYVFELDRGTRSVDGRWIAVSALFLAYSIGIGGFCGAFGASRNGSGA